VIRGLVRLAALGTVAAYGVDRFLGARRDDRPPAPIRSMVVIDAPVERVWAELADVEGQPRWMLEMKRVRVLTPGPIRVGTRAEAEVRILGITVADPVEIVEFRPPHRFAIRHEGLFSGGGVIELTPGADGRSTIVTWDETLVPPFLPHLGAAVQEPVLASIFQADLHRFRELLETPRPATADDAASLAMEAEGAPPTPGEVATALGGLDVADGPGAPA
jgi:uncharacterized membrane protein